MNGEKKETIEQRKCITNHISRIIYRQDETHWFPPRVCGHTNERRMDSSDDMTVRHTAVVPNRLSEKHKIWSQLCQLLYLHNTSYKTSSEYKNLCCHGTTFLSLLIVCAPNIINLKSSSEILITITFPNQFLTLLWFLRLHLWTFVLFPIPEEAGDPLMIHWHLWEGLRVGLCIPKLRFLHYVSWSSGFDEPQKNRCGQKQDVLTNPSVHPPGWQQLDFTRRDSTRSLAGSENEFDFFILLFYEHVRPHYSKMGSENVVTSSIPPSFDHITLLLPIDFHLINIHLILQTLNYNSRSKICGRSFKSFCY